MCIKRGITFATTFSWLLKRPLDLDLMPEVLVSLSTLDSRATGREWRKRGVGLWVVVGMGRDNGYMFGYDRDSGRVGIELVIG